MRGKSRPVESAEKIGGGKIVEFGGRAMGGLYFVEADDYPDALFEKWKSLALSHALSLPPK